MPITIQLSHADIEIAAKRVAEELVAHSPVLLSPGSTTIWAYAIPRGGVFAAYAIQLALSKKGLPFDLQLVTNPSDADIFIDDLIDSGRTLERFCEAHTERPFFALFDKREGVYGSNWVSFPWEQNEAEETVDDNIVRLLQYIGESPNREGLQETPARAVKAWDFWTKGYSQKPEDVLKVFEDGADGYDGMVIVKDIPLYSKCEHHMADIFGTATIAYIPNGKIVGLSKLSRLLDVFARRLQVQERLTCQVANAIDEHLNPLGVGVVIKARHMCMESRGICQQGHQTITCALRGVLKDDPSARAEFMALAK